MTATPGAPRRPRRTDEVDVPPDDGRGTGSPGATGGVVDGSRAFADQPPFDEEHGDVEGDADEGDGEERREQQRDVEQAAAREVDEDAEAATRRRSTRR